MEIKYINPSQLNVQIIDIGDIAALKWFCNGN